MNQIIILISNLYIFKYMNVSYIVICFWLSIVLLPVSARLVVIVTRLREALLLSSVPVLFVRLDG